MPAIEKETKKPEPTYSEIRLEKKDKGQQEPRVEIGTYPFNNNFYYIYKQYAFYKKQILLLLFG